MKQARVDRGGKKIVCRRDRVDVARHVKIELLSDWDGAGRALPVRDSSEPCRVRDKSFITKTDDHCEDSLSDLSRDCVDGSSMGAHCE